jgi:hypothetical protein
MRKSSKKALSSLLVVTMVIGILSFSTVFVVAAESVWDGTTDITWYTSNPSATSFTISTGAELAGLASIVTAGTDSFLGDTITLMEDIDLDNRSWTPIGASSSGGNHFYGTFDGNYHVISNLNGTDNSFGLFCYLCGTVKNLGIEGFTYVNGSQYPRTGAIARTLGRINTSSEAGIIENCYVQNVSITLTVADWGSNSALCGGMVGQMICGSVTDCYVRGVAYDVTTPHIHCAGLGAILSLGQNLDITNFYVTGVTGQTDSFMNDSVGSGTLTVTNCYYTESKTTNSLKTQITTEELKGYAATLGDAFKADTSNSNEGYPVLVWQRENRAYDITNFEINKSGSIFTASADFENFYYEENEGSAAVLIIIATYKEDNDVLELVNIVSESYTVPTEYIEEGISVDISEPDGYSDATHVVKAFIFDSFNNIKPYTESITYSADN